MDESLAPLYPAELNDQLASGSGNNAATNVPEVKQAHQNFISTPDMDSLATALTTQHNKGSFEPIPEESSDTPGPASQFLRYQTLPIRSSEKQSVYHQEQSGGEQREHFFPQLRKPQNFVEREGEITRLKEKIEKAEKEKTLLESKLKETEEKLGEVGEELEEVREELKEVREDLQKKNEEIKKMKKDFADLNERLQDQIMDSKLEKSRIEGERNAYREMVLQHQHPQHKPEGMNILFSHYHNM